MSPQLDAEEFIGLVTLRLLTCAHLARRETEVVWSFERVDPKGVLRYTVTGRSFDAPNNRTVSGVVREDDMNAEDASKLVDHLVELLVEP